MIEIINVTVKTPRGTNHLVDDDGIVFSYLEVEVKIGGFEKELLFDFNCQIEYFKGSYIFYNADWQVKAFDLQSLAQQIHEWEEKYAQNH